MKTKNNSMKSLSLMGVFVFATILSSATLLSSPSAYAADQTCTWTGAIDNKFSTAANWKECAGDVPTAGDIIRFDRFPTINSNQQLTNDLGVALGGLVVQQQAEELSSNEKNYYVNIDTLTFVNNAIIKKDKINIDKNDGFVKVRADKIIGQGNLIVAGGVGEYGAKTVFEVTDDLIAKSNQFYPSVNSKAYRLVLSATESEYDAFYEWSTIKNVNYDSLVIQRKVVFIIDADAEIKKPIYIERGDGKILTYRVTEKETKEVDKVDMNKLMTVRGSAEEGLNLITCDGKWNREKGTFNKRTIIYSEIVH